MTEQDNGTGVAANRRQVLENSRVIVETREARISAFISLQEKIAKGVFLQAWLVYEEKRAGGSVAEFARDVGITPSWAYKLLHHYEAFGDDPIKNLSPTAHIVAASKAKGDPAEARKWAEKAADNGWSKARLAVEMDKAKNGPPKEIEVGEAGEVYVEETCKWCGGRGTMYVNTENRGERGNAHEHGETKR